MYGPIYALLFKCNINSNGIAFHQQLVSEMRCEEKRLEVTVPASSGEHNRFQSSPSAFLTHQGISSVIGCGNPSCLQITGA